MFIIKLQVYIYICVCVCVCSFKKVVLDSIYKAIFVTFICLLVSES